MTALLTSSPLRIHRRALERKRKARIEEGPGGRSLRNPEGLQDFPGLCPHTPSTWCRETGPEFLFPSAVSGEQTTRNHQMMVPCFLPPPQKDFVHTLICCLVRGPKRANATGAPTRCEGAGSVCLWYTSFNFWLEGKYHQVQSTVTSRILPLSFCYQKSEWNGGHFPCLPLQSWRQTKGWILAPSGALTKPHQRKDLCMSVLRGKWGGGSEASC